MPCSRAAGLLVAEEGNEESFISPDKIIPAGDEPAWLEFFPYFQNFLTALHHFQDGFPSSLSKIIFAIFSLSSVSERHAVLQPRESWRQVRENPTTLTCRDKVPPKEKATPKKKQLCDVTVNANSALPAVFSLTQHIIKSTVMTLGQNVVLIFSPQQII